MPDSSTRPLTSRLLRFGFRQLYTRFAWTYDAVAAVVSLGEWQVWGRAALRFIEESGTSPDRKSSIGVLEIAHGPGHLHLSLRQAGYRAVGIDLSPQMSRIAAQRLRRAGLSNSLARANVMRLPFPDAAFDALISTFPAEFIFAPQTLREAARVLVAGGRLVIVPSATPHEGNLLIQAATAWQRITRLSERDLDNTRQLFMQAGFTFEQHSVPSHYADAVVWVCARRRP